MPSLMQWYPPGEISIPHLLRANGVDFAQGAAINELGAMLL